MDLSPSKEGDITSMQAEKVAEKLRFEEEAKDSEFAIELLSKH